MIIVKSPFRISFFGGSTDYKSFYKKHGSFIIATTINKYVWQTGRGRPKILPREHSISYSKLETVSNINQIENPLIREVFRYCKMKDYIDFNSSADIPSRTGLGGSSSFCAGLLYLLKTMKGQKISKKDIAKSAINIERNILKDSGGIQDQILTSYGGLNTVEIDRKGNFKVRPLPVSEKFKKDLENSIVLIYTNNQRDQDEIAKSHEHSDKKKILELSRQAYKLFIKEDIKAIGELLFESWQEKRKISLLISTPKIDAMVSGIMKLGAYGAKLLGSGGCGFILAICSPTAKEKIIKKFKDNILEIEFETQGTSLVYSENT